MISQKDSDSSQETLSFLSDPPSASCLTPLYVSFLISHQDVAT